MTLDDWFAFATSDADRRALHDLRPVLKGLQGAAAALRAAEWNDDARGQATPDVDAMSSKESQQPQQTQPSPRASS